MPIRTIMTSVTFKNSFSLGARNDPQPPGRYTVETDEERLEGLSFIAYRRVRTFMHIPSRPDRRGISEILEVDPSELEVALELDAPPSLAPPVPATVRTAPRSGQVLVLIGADRQAIEQLSEN